MADFKHDGKRFLLDNVDPGKFFDQISPFNVMEARFKSVGETAVVKAGEELVRGKVSDFIDTLRHNPGEIIKSDGETYVVQMNGEWRLI